MAPILKAAFAGIGDQQITSVVSAGLVLTGIAVSFEMQLFPPRYKIRNISFTQIAYILIASSFATCILYFSPLAKVFAGDFSGLYSLFSLIPPVLIIIIMELERRID